jgi:hypothetical protein
MHLPDHGNVSVFQLPDKLAWWRIAIADDGLCIYSILCVNDFLAVKFFARHGLLLA